MSIMIDTPCRHVSTRATSSRDTLDGPAASIRTRGARTRTPAMGQASAPASPLRTSPRRAKVAAAEQSAAVEQPPAGPPEVTDASGLPNPARPWAFFPLSNNPRHSEVREPEPIPNDVFMHPDDDPAAMRGIPIFRPTMEEFRQFDVYMETVRPWGERSSIVKIVPPAEWVADVQLLDKHKMSELEIRSPIEQRLKGNNGVFMQLNVERNRNRPLSIHEWFVKCNSHPDLRTPNPKEGDRSLNRDSKEARAERDRRIADTKAARLAARLKREAAAKRRQERLRAEAEKEEETANGALDESTSDIDAAYVEDLPALDADSATHTSPEPVMTTPPSEPAEPTIDPFYEEDWKKAWLPEGITQDDFDVAGCTRIENKFWKSLGTGKKDSWYGADLAGTLFADEEYPWNVAHLPNLLNKLPRRIPGVNSPYLYFGMWRAAFSWHVEDMDLFSINYIHFGAPKLWYAVPQIGAEHFESVVRSYFPSDANGCDQFMRHKSCTVSPSKLHTQGVRVNKMVQYQNEFVVTFPRGYHAGFNLGFNCAESVNFALPSWLDLGRKAKACTCVDFSVRIDVDLLMSAKQPFPSPSPEPQRKRKAADSEEGGRRKRKTLEAKEDPESTPITPRLPEKVIPLTPTSTSKVAHIVRDTPARPCVLCPSLATEDLAPVFQPDDFIRSLSKTTAVQAHTSCAIALPEAYTEEVTIMEADGTTEQVVTYIKGLENIDKARWKLKCNCCADKRTALIGTKVQCTMGKCVRAFHVPCARSNDEVHYYAGSKVQPSPATAEGAEGTAEGAADDKPDFVVELLCQAHNPAAVAIKQRRVADRVAQQLLNKVRDIEPGSMIKFKTTGGVFAAQHMETKEETRRVIVRLPDMSEREIAWSSLDFRPTPQAQENEYALPPKRSRREIVPAPQFVDPVHYQMPEEHMGYHPRANAVVLVDSKAHSHGHPFPNGPGLGHFVSHPMRGMPPPMLPGMGMRGMGGRAAIVPPRVQAPFRMAATTGAPQPNGGGVVNGNNGGRSNAPGGPAQCPPHTPVIPGGVGKIDLGLDRMIALMGKLPPMTVPAFHLAGTNGKGSVSVILESCLNAAGMRTARYNSPHLLEPRDAVRLNGHPVSAEEYAAAISHVQRVSDENRLEATTFEIGTAAAFLIANTAQPPVDAMIIECGMGGLRDATNVLPPQLVLASGLTSVGLDHTDRLGDTIAKIAREKSSICVPGGVLVVAPHLHPQALESARTVTAERGSHIVVSAASQATRTDTTMSLVPFREPAPTFVRTPLAGAKTRVLDTQLSLGGAHQLDNLSLALTLLDVVRNDARSRSIQPKLEYLVDSRLQAGVAAARWHGRCAWLQWRDPHTGTTVPFLVDGAHNADSAVTLRAYLDSLDVPGPRTFVISLSASPGKTPDGVLRPLLRRGDRLALAQFTTPVEGMPWIRAADSEDLRAAALPLTDGGEIHTVPGVGPAAVAEALRWAQNGHGGQGLTVLCGSLYLVAEAYRLVAQ